MTLTEADMQILRRNITRGLATLSDEEIALIDINRLDIACTRWCPLGQARGWPEQGADIAWIHLTQLGFYPPWHDSEPFMNAEWIDQITTRRNARNK